MTVYTVPVADSLLTQKEFWAPVPGFRLLEVVGPWPQHPHVTLCRFEDEGAPAELEGKLVEPVIQTDFEGECARVIDRVVVSG